MIYDEFREDLFRCSILLRDELLHDLVEHYPKLRPNCMQNKGHPRRPKLAAARSAAANFVRRLCRVFCVQFWRNFGVIFNQIVQ